MRNVIAMAISTLGRVGWKAAECSNGYMWKAKDSAYHFISERSFRAYLIEIHASSVFKRMMEKSISQILLLSPLARGPLTCFRISVMSYGQSFNRSFIFRFLIWNFSPLPSSSYGQRILPIQDGMGSPPFRTSVLR